MQTLYIKILITSYQPKDAVLMGILVFSSIFWHISLSRSIPSQLPAVPFQIIASTWPEQADRLPEASYPQQIVW